MTIARWHIALTVSAQLYVLSAYALELTMYVWPTHRRSIASMCGRH